MSSLLLSRFATGMLALAVTLPCPVLSSEPSSTDLADSRLEQAEYFSRAEHETFRRKLTFERLLRERDRLENRLSAVGITEPDVARLETALHAAAERLRTEATTLSLDPVRPIVSGDTLHILATAEESIRGSYVVRRGGYIVMPRIGRVFVTGKNLAQSGKAIEEALATHRLRQGEVAVERTCLIPGLDTSGHVYLSGEFKQPGETKLPGENPTVVTAVIKSGGMAPNADLTRVRLLRQEDGRSIVEEVNVRAMLNGNGLASDLPIKAGDVIEVGAFAPSVQVTGNVASPGSVPLSSLEEIGAYSAIVRCGGLLKNAAPERVFVLRDRQNGQKIKLPVNIDDVLHGKVADVVLQGSDIVVVP